MSKVAIKCIFSFPFRVGVVFTGTSGDSMEVKSLGKPERYYFLLFVSFEGQSGSEDQYNFLLLVLFAHKKTLPFHSMLFFNAFPLMSSRQLAFYSLPIETETQKFFLSYAV